MTAAPPEPRTIDATRLQDLLQQGDAPTIIDVRSPAEFETSHIPGSVSVPVDFLGQHPELIASAVGEGAVLVCQAGPRAVQAHEHLTRAGRPELQVLDGGMNTWEGAGGPVERGKQTWALERQVRFAAGSLVLLGVLGSLVAPKARFLSGAIGGGLVYSAVSDTCAMGTVLARMPWNRGPGSPRAEQVVEQLAG